MTMYALLAALCVVPLARSMFLNPGMGSFEGPSYDAPDAKIYRRSPFGHIQAFDVSRETRYAPNAYGGLSQYSVMEISDPDIIPGMAVPGQRSFFPSASRFGMNSIASPAAGGLGTAAMPLMGGMSGMNTAGGLNNMNTGFSMPSFASNMVSAFPMMG